MMDEVPTGSHSSPAIVSLEIRILKTASPWLKLLALLVVLAIPFLLFGWWFEPTLIAWVQSDWLREHPVVGACLGIGLLTVDILLPVPASVVCTVQGSVWGAVWGGLFNWIGLSASSALGWWLGGRPSLRRWLGQDGSGDKVSWLDRDRLHDHSGWLLATCRPFPLLAETSVIAAGMYRVPVSRIWLPLGMANAGLAWLWAALGAWAVKVEGLGILLLVSAVLPAAGLAIWEAQRLRKNRRTRTAEQIGPDDQG